MTRATIRQPRLPPADHAKDLLDVAEMPRLQIDALLRLARSLKVKQRRGIGHSLLPGSTLGLCFKSRPRAPVSRLKPA